MQEEAGATANIPQVVLPNGIANKNGDGDDDDDSDDGDTLSFFSDSLSTLFNVHSPARGSPGGHLTWTHPALLTPIAYKVPNHTGTSTSLFAHYQWDAGIELCKELCVGGSPNSAFDVSGKTVCELGAGTGLPSLVCARLGAVKVVVTDYPDEGILSTLKENVKSEKREDTVVEGLMWGDVAQEERVLRCVFMAAKASHSHAHTTTRNSPRTRAQPHCRKRLRRPDHLRHALGLFVTHAPHPLPHLPLVHHFTTRSHFSLSRIPHRSPLRGAFLCHVSRG